MALQFQFQFRRGTAAEWEEGNPILAPGEPGLETDTGNYKIGNGVTPWLFLPTYVDSQGLRAAIESQVENAGGVTQAQLTTHIEDPNPHPAYDDGQSFALLYKNAKV